MSVDPDDPTSDVPVFPECIMYSKITKSEIDNLGKVDCV